MAQAKHEIKFINDHQVNNQGQDNTPEQQARALWDNEISPRLAADPAAKIGLLYSANQTQADSIQNGYAQNKVGTIDGSGQAPVFAELNKIINDAGMQSRVHVLPIATSVTGGADTPTENRVSKKSLDVDLANVLAHQNNGFEVMGFGRLPSYDAQGRPYNNANPRPNGLQQQEFSIGGGNSAEFIKDQAFMQNKSRQQYIQQQLELMSQNLVDQLDAGIKTELPQAVTNLTQSTARARNSHKVVFDGKVDPLVAFYNQSFRKDDSSYEPGYEEPQVVGKGARLAFPDVESSTQFLRNYAEQYKDSNFVVRNEKEEVIAYIKKGKIHVFDGDKGFKEADADTLLPTKGMALGEFKKFEQIQKQKQIREELQEAKPPAGQAIEDDLNFGPNNVFEPIDETDFEPIEVEESEPINLGEFVFDEPQEAVHEAVSEDIVEERLDNSEPILEAPSESEEEQHELTHSEDTEGLNNDEDNPNKYSL